MEGEDTRWHYAGSATVTDNGKINIPERVFDEEILKPNRVAYWAYEVNLGFVLVSNQPLDEKERYKPQGNSDVGASEDSYRTNIPKVFFEDYTGRGRGNKRDPVPEQARVNYKERRFFAYREQMAESGPRSCYLFDWDEFDSTLSDANWADPLDDLPRFITG